jgi:hypothetical protein
MDAHFFKGSLRPEALELANAKTERERLSILDRMDGDAGPQGPDDRSHRDWLAARELQREEHADQERARLESVRRAELERRGPAQPEGRGVVGALPRIAADEHDEAHEPTHGHDDDGDHGRPEHASEDERNRAEGGLSLHVAHADLRAREAAAADGHEPDAAPVKLLPGPSSVPATQPAKRPAGGGGAPKPQHPAKGRKGRGKR